MLVLNRWQEEVLAVKKAVAELLPVAEKAREVLVDAGKKGRSLEMELSLLTHSKASFEGVMTAVHMESSAARVECAPFRWNRDEVLSKLKTLETEQAESVKVVFREATYGSSLKPKSFRTENFQGLEKVFADLKHKAAKITGGLKRSSSEFTNCTRREIASRVALLSHRLNVREDSSVELSMSVLSTSTATSGTGASTPPGPRSKQVPQ